MVRELAEMSDRGGGAIVNMSSVAGVAGFPVHAPYTASKFAVRGLIRVAALEYATKNVRINAVCPAYVDTLGLRDGAPPGSELYQTFAKQQPINRMARRKKSPKRSSGFCQTQPPSSPVAISSSTAATSPGRDSQSVPEPVPSKWVAFRSRRRGC
jgi:NAD(P)-dependent dehydrogenase (short-subunit alcohol dehydrogenase family)